MNDARETLVRIDSQLGGPPMSLSDASALESAWAGFQQEFDPRAKQSVAQLDEMAKLLQVTDDNLEVVKNQKWFQRAWATVSRKNAKLAKVNQQNLLVVQKGAFFFLEGLAAQNQMLMQAVYLALQRVEDNQIQNERLKVHLLTAVKKYNARISDLESRQVHLEGRLDAHERQLAGRSSKGLGWALLLGGACLLAVGAAAVSFGGDFEPLAQLEASWVAGLTWGPVALGTGLIAGGLVALIRGSLGQNRTQGLDGTPRLDPEAIRRERIRQINRRLRPKLLDSYGEALSERYLHLASESLIQPVIEAISVLDQAFDGAKDDEDWANAMGVYLRVSADVRQAMDAQAHMVAGTIVEELNGLFTVLVDNFLEGDLGMKLSVELDRSRQTQLAQGLQQAHAAYDSSIEAIETTRLDLLARYPRWKDVTTEHIAYALGKAFLKGATLIPLLFDDEQEFMEAFGSDVKTLTTQWATFREMLVASFDVRLESALRGIMSDTTGRLGTLFDAFDEAGISLEDVERAVGMHAESEGE
jgi:hypothetical protein